MTISGISTAALQAIEQQSGQQQSGTTNSAQTALQSAASGFSGSSAYTLSLGQQQDASSLLGYGQLGKLVTQAEGTLGGMDRNNPAATATVGGGTPLQQTYSVDVQQLAQAQVLTSGGYSDASQVIGTGTLTVQAGTYDSSSNTFSPNNSTTIDITDGSLTGIAAAINGANLGLSAQVTTGSDGQSQLQVTGPTGAADAFSLSGISGLAYDPTTPSFTGLEATQSAQDALYSVNGGAVQNSSTNQDVPVASGVTTTLTATGTTTVSVPFGQAAAVGAAQALVSAVNTLVGGLGQMTGSGGELAGDTGIASQLTKALEQVAGQSYSGAGQFSSLSDIGITVQSDGTLAIDQSTLQSAYATDPTGTRALLDQASKAVQQVLGGTQGAGEQIKSEMAAFAQKMVAVPSLAELLGQTQSSSASSQSSAANPFGSSSQTSTLASMLQSSPSLAAELAKTSQGQSLLASLGLGTSGSASTGSSSTGTTAAGSTASSLAQLLASTGSSSTGSSSASSSASSLEQLLSSLGTTA
jgi:flagellar hook-associated protein 2